MTESSVNNNNSIKIALISSVGNWLADTLFYPLDTISTRLKANQHSNNNTISYVIKAIKSERFKLFRGVELTFHATFIPSLVYFSIYDYGMSRISYYLEKNQNDNSTKLAFPFFVSSFAQIFALVLYLPVDTIRKRIQVNQQYNYKSFSRAMKQISEKEGFSRFFKSSKIFFLSKTLYTAVLFQTFETIRYFVGPSFHWMIINTIASTAFAVLLMNPLQVLITRYALVDTTKQKLVLRKMLKEIFQRQGIKGFYKGYLADTLYASCYALFQLPVYQIARQNFGASEKQ